MANRWFQQFTSSLIKKLCVVYGEITFGASGAISSFSGNGVKSVTKLATGVFQIQLQDQFNHFYGAEFTLLSGVGTNPGVNDGSFVVDTLYQIQTVGDTDWPSVGLNSGLSPAAGQAFVASASGGSGSGVVKAISPSGIVAIEVAQDPQEMLEVSTPSAGSILIFQCYDTSDALANPLTGSKIQFALSYRNSFLSA